MRRPSPRHRAHLATLVTTLMVATALSGCLDAQEADALGTFYPMTFLAQQIGGDVIEIGQIIPDGTEPHEWDPSVRDLTRLTSSQLVVAQGLDFEPWLAPILSNLGDTAPRVVYSANEIDVPDLDDHDHADEHDNGHDNGDDHGHSDNGDHDNDHDNGDGHGHDDNGDTHNDHGAVHELLLVDRSSDKVTADVHGDHWHGSLPSIPLDDRLSVGAIFLDDHDEEIPLGEGTDHRFDARIARGSDEIVRIESHGDHIHIYGLVTGHTSLIFQFIDDDEVEWESPQLWVSVTDSDDDHHGGRDPHTWNDPVLLAQQAVKVRDALTQVFPEHTETFRANTEDLLGRLHDLDAAYQTRLADCETRNIIVQHNAFAYLSERYGFQVHSVMGLSPQAEPNPQAVASMIDKAVEHDLQVVFTETLASPTVMNAIARDASAKGTQVEVQVLNPLERRSQQEIQEGLDLLDIMYNNLDALASAMRCT